MFRPPGSVRTVRRLCIYSGLRHTAWFKTGRFWVTLRTLDVLALSGEFRLSEVYTRGSIPHEA